MKQKWTISRPGRKDNGVYYLDIGQVKAGETFSILAVGDPHIDNPRHHSSLFGRHMSQAVDNDWPVLMIGDFYDAKEGRFDPRADRTKKDELNGPDSGYINHLVDYGARRIEPYADNIALMGEGNHEASLRKNMDVDIMHLLGRELTARGKQAPMMAGYHGWVIVRYKMSTVSGRVAIRFHHGTGGNSPVSRGAIKAHRRATFIEGADFVISGHIHTPDYSHYRSEYVTNQGRLAHRDTIHLVVPGYQRSDAYKAGGWEIMKEFPPQPCGCARLDIEFGDREKESRSKGGVGRKTHHCNYQFLLE